jgi:multidrug efflux pump subunit AcrB
VRDRVARTAEPARELNPRSCVLTTTAVVMRSRSGDRWSASWPRSPTTVRPFLERVRGGDVTIDGRLERAIDVRIDVDRPAAYRIPITDVRTALSARTPRFRRQRDAGRRDLVAGP